MYSLEVFPVINKSTVGLAAMCAAVSHPDGLYSLALISNRNRGEQRAGQCGALWLSMQSRAVLEGWDTHTRSSGCCASARPSQSLTLFMLTCSLAPPDSVMHCCCCCIVSVSSNSEDFVGSFLSFFHFFIFMISHVSVRHSAALCYHSHKS